ncbi:MAG: hypothetical protein EBY20_03175 [Alphaproteobacteria bacterium]|nr:hypothetical protein [Alphaproteobacteria bacterium]NDE19090.1 hypothetical protein [Alphaproteobacteria bacterium]
MALTAAERQQKRRNRLKNKNLSFVQVWVPKDKTVEIKAIAAKMAEEEGKDLEPSPRQLAFAQFLCDKKGLKLSQDVLVSSKRLSEWLNENKKAKDKVE